ncbi:VIP36-like protein [Oscarella lobularis]|uniref:VIP36-like protein n=1 Tax=Oscarella lobularis TaxID=121494 RepID=UPI003313C11E
MAFSSLLLPLLVIVAAEAQYLKREYTLTKPYQGSGMDLPNWDFSGSTVVTNNYIRLTPDRQSKRGMLWNKIPAAIRNWEIQAQFKVHGQGKTLYGDGFAIWYTKDKSEFGDVFGSRDYFTGLGIFFDTYSNHNGEHAHPHPYVSAIVANGSVHYDHDRDGTHSEVAGCHVQFRNLEEDTHASILYADRTLTVNLDVDGNYEWQECFRVEEVDLPAGYYFGVSAATGDLADNHDIISFKVFELENKGDDSEDGWMTAAPAAAKHAAPREHISDPQSSRQGTSLWTVLFVVFLVVALVCGVVVYFVFQPDRSRRQRLF